MNILQLENCSMNGFVNGTYTWMEFWIIACSYMQFILHPTLEFPYPVIEWPLANVFQQRFSIFVCVIIFARRHIHVRKRMRSLSFLALEKISPFVRPKFMLAGYFCVTELKVCEKHFLVAYNGKHIWSRFVHCYIQPYVFILWRILHIGDMSSCRVHNNWKPVSIV